MAKPRLFQRIREELKQTVRLFLEELRREHPAEHFYALMFEVDVSETYAIRIAASEESLTRWAQAYIANGYKVRSGDLLEVLRTALRWDAPGDSRVGWYWGNQDDDRLVTQLIDQAVKEGLIDEYDETRPLQKLCMDALRELDQEGALGVRPARERLLIGTSCMEFGFGEDEDVEQLATLNPSATIARLRQQLAAEAAANELLIHPR
jgi:hypothetical protein